VAGLVESALARSIPVLIGFLAALLGVGGLADKVKSVIQAISRPVMKVVDWVVDKIAGVARKFWAKLKGAFGKKDGKGATQDPATGDDSPAGKQRRLDQGMAAAETAMSRYSGQVVGQGKVNELLAPIQQQYRMTSLTAVQDGDEWDILGEVNPKKEKKTRAQPPKSPYPVNIAEMEGEGRHTMANHVGRTDEQMRKRLEEEQDIPGASTFTNTASAQLIVQSVINENEQPITDWLNNERANRRLVLNPARGSVTGRTITREMWLRDKHCSPVTTNEITVVLRKRQGFGHGFILVTAYPGPPD
jgi:hypothetical protein